MAKPITYRRVGEGAHKKCDGCAHFVKLTSWCRKWNFVANEVYVCSKWKKGLDEAQEESDLKKRYRTAIGEKKMLNREENYAKSYTPDPKPDDYEDGFILRYFAKQSNNPYSPIIEIDETQYRSSESAQTGIDGSFYDVVEVQWTIAGDRTEVLNSNINIADYIETRYPKMIGLKDYLYGNLVRFWEGGKKA